MKKIIFLTLILFLGFITLGCRTYPAITLKCFDIFYKIKDDKVKDNKVVVALGNRYYNEDGTLWHTPDIEYYDNFMIEVYVDSMEEYAEQIKISREDYFSYEYRVLLPHTVEHPSKPSEYNKTFEFNLRNYNISKYIKFILSYTGHGPELEDSTYRLELDLYGKTVGSTFIVEDFKRMMIPIKEVCTRIYYKIERENGIDKVKDNKVTVALGNRAYNEDGSLWFGPDSQKRYDNFMITVYVDTMDEYAEQIKISREDFFSYDYRILVSNEKEDLDTLLIHNKTFEFNLEKYNVSEYIKFIVSYTKKNEEIEDNTYKVELYLLGKTVDSVFAVNIDELNYGWESN